MNQRHSNPIARISRVHPSAQDKKQSTDSDLRDEQLQRIAAKYQQLTPARKRLFYIAINLVINHQVDGLDEYQVMAIAQQYSDKLAALRAGLQ